MQPRHGFWALTFGMLLLFGCGNPGEQPAGGGSATSDGSTATTEAGPIRIDGSSTVYPITEAVLEEYRAVEPKLKITAGFSGTGGGFKKFIAGETEINDASRPIKDKEKASLDAEGIEFIELEVAFDGLAVIVNPENDWCDCLTVAQLKEMWRPGSAVKKWKDVNPEWPDEEIKLYGPGPDSGTFDYFTEAIVGEAQSSRSDFEKSEDDNQLVNGIKGSKYALGYFGFAYYAANEDSLKLLAVENDKGECVKPSLETVRDGSYNPLSRPLFIYVRNDALQRPEVAKFVRFYLDNAAELSKDVGYVPVSDDAVKQNDERFKAATTADATTTE